VGNAYPHKNLEKLIDAFKDLRKKNPGIQLVLVGKEDYFYKRIKDRASSDGLWNEESRDNAIIFPDYVPDEKLEVLYKQSIAYVFPSLYEGFGLPPLEAMAKGCPVVSSWAASMPEILGDAALYFDPEKRGDIKNKMETVRRDGELRKKMIRKGYEQAKKYSWWECARETLEVYRKTINT
jgi:glycosyltransferase involved in cell wall biosynthesis